MSKKIILIFFTIFLASILNSCQLAIDGGTNVQGDQLIGVFVTTEHLDLFDFNSYANDNMQSFLNNKNIEITLGDKQKYSDRIYAIQKPVQFAHSKEHLEYVFDELNGVPLFYFENKLPNGESYSVNPSTDAISDLLISVGDKTSLEGTIYIAQGSSAEVYPNPVYQSSDGQVYLTATDGGFILSGVMSEGSVYTQTLEESHTIMKNGEETEKSFKVAVKFAVKFPTTSLSIIQMNAENILISQEKHSIEDLPEDIEMNEDTAYVIVESYVNSPDGELVTREIFDQNHESFTSYVERDDGICIGKYTSLLWEK